MKKMIFIVFLEKLSYERHFFENGNLPTCSVVGYELCVE